MRWFRAAASQGLQDARCSLGYMFMNGLGTPADPAKAFRLYRIAAEGGNKDGMFHAGVCLEFGEGTEADLKKAAAWYRRAAEKGDAESAYRLGIILSEGGDGIGKDPAGSFEWTVKAAAGGFPDAMVQAATDYLTGYGTEQSREEAVKWLNLAKEAGAAGAEEILASLGKGNSTN